MKFRRMALFEDIIPPVFQDDVNGRVLEMEEEEPISIEREKENIVVKQYLICVQILLARYHYLSIIVRNTL